MPWSAEQYPPAMKNLAPPVRQRAIDIANALLALGYDDGPAIRIGIARAKQWARAYGLDRLQAA